MTNTNQNKKPTWLIIIVALLVLALIAICALAALAFAGLVSFNILGNISSPGITPSEQITMYISSETAECGDVEPQTCLLVKFDEEAQWDLFYDDINGFEYEPGFEYELLVDKIENVNLSTDTSLIEYWLVEIVSKTAGSAS